VGRNLLVNGGFENSADRGAQTVNTFDPAVDGWISRTNGNFGTYLYGDLAVGNTPAQAGQRQLGFNTGQTAPNAWIEQAVTVQPGSTYRLSFYSSRSGHPDFQGGAIRSLILDGSRSVLSSNTVITDQAVGQWNRSAQFVTATDSNLIVRFEDASTATTNTDPMLDSVELVQVTVSDPTDSDGDGLTDAWERGYGRYQIIPGNFTWEQAKADAEARGGHLATITSLQESDFIYTILGSTLGDNSYKDTWLGANDATTEGDWRWVTGEVWSYSRWGPSEPNGSTFENFLTLINRTTIGHIPGITWNDSGNSLYSMYLLEFGYPTDPTKADTDGDGYNDNEETVAKTDPNNSNDPPQSQTGGLIAYYPFDGNVNDALGEQPPLTLFGSRNFLTNGLSGGALRTDGDRSLYYNGGGYFSPAYLENSSLNAASFVFWTRNDQTGGAYSPSHTEEAWLEVGYGDTGAVAQIYGRALGTSGTFGTVTVNWADWKMFTMTISNNLTGSDWVQYLNGTETARGSTSQKLLPNANIKFGKHTWNAGAAQSARMTVEWDNLRIYNKSLSAAEIQALYLQDAPNTDTNAPVITLIGSNPLEIYKGATFSDLGAMVTDNVDATRTIMGSGTVNTATVGIYTLTYTAADAAGNLAVPVTRTVNVVLDPAADEDGDGLSNGQELTLGTDPYKKDTDGDGVNDPVEVADGTNPKDATSFKSLSQGLVAYYPFSGNAKDESGNGHQGTLVNSTVSESGLAEAGNSLRISGGMDSWMAVADSSLFRPRGFTISMWIYNNLSDDSGVRYVCGKNYEQMEIHLSNSVNSKSGIRFIPTNGCYVDTLAGTPASQWFHLVCIAGEGSEGGKIYINGVEVPVSRLGSVDGAQPINLGSDPFYLGRRTENGWQHLDGRMDNVRVYGRTLSASEIAQLYQTEAGSLDSDGDGLTDAWEQGFGRYQIVSGNFTWDQAKADAEARGGHLATITSQDEWNVIWSQLGPTWNGANYWLGGSDQGSEGNWHWVTGENWSFSRWYPSEPSGGAENELITWANLPDGQPSWNDGLGNNLPGSFGGYVLENGYPTDPTKADTDGDGFNDKVESLAGTDPNSATVFPNPDWDFSFGFSNINEAGAETYLTATSGVRKYSEWQNPPTTYWGPTANEVDGALTYRFPASQPIRAARLKASTDSYNFPWPGYFGSGKGWSSIWGSKDGSNWVLVMDNPMPTDNVGRGMAYDQTLPAELLGAQELWIQIRLRVTEAPNSSYTTAQFGRGSAANTQRIFEVKIDYDGLYPEIGQASLGNTRQSLSSSIGEAYSIVLDSDSDGQSDAVELAAGSDPNSGNSRFCLSLTMEPASLLRTQSDDSTTTTTGKQAIVLTWPSVPGKTYELQKSTDLHNWVVVQEAQSEAYPATETTIRTFSSDEKSFYRILLKNN
jgi:hypothetical protein